MKLIKKNDLIKVIQSYPEDKEFSGDLLMEVVEKYGDTWYIVDGSWKQTKKNQTMKELRGK